MNYKIQNTEVNTLISCVASTLKQWTCHVWPDAPFRFIMMVQSEQIQAFWQSPIDHHSILLAICFVVSFFINLIWVSHKFTENGEFYIVRFLALPGIIETPAFLGWFWKHFGGSVIWASKIILCPKVGWFPVPNSHSNFQFFKENLSQMS